MVQRKAPSDALGRSGRVGTACASLARDERGQALPLLLLVMVFFLAAGVLFYQLALSTNYATVAQTAADAAALGAEENVVQQLQQPWTFVNGTWEPPAVNWNDVENQASQYASDNQGTLVQMEPPIQEPWGYDVVVIVRTSQGLPAGSVDAAKHAVAEARASTDPLSQSSPPVPISNEASTATHPRFQPHGGTVGFFEASGANYNVGQEPEIAGSLDELGIREHIKIVGQIGYTPARSRGDMSLHTCGDASTTAGLEHVTDQKLKDAGLERLSPVNSGKPVEPEEIALAGTTLSSCVQPAAPSPAGVQPPPVAGNADVHLVDLNGGPQDPLVSFIPGGLSALGGPWVIPTPIVMCESGGRDLTPNSAGASGYYQIIPSTWALYGGTQYTQQAYQAPKNIQDLIASRIWNGGAGWKNWDCASMVKWA